MDKFSGNSPVHFKYRKKKILSSPIMINLEITDACNLTCRHCYNFWREDPASATAVFSKEKMDRFVELVKEAEVFHVVLTGGEPFANFDVLEYGLQRMADEGISTSVNSNLALVNTDKIKRLKDAGLDHILTSLVSCDPVTNDHLMDRPGIFEKIIQGIKTTVAGGIRVSVNMVISELNREHVYETARLCSETGVQRIFGTRLVPSVNVKEPGQREIKLDQESAIKAIDDLLRAKNDFGIQVGTLISYPLCLLGNLEKYQDFVGRGCPAKSGTRMSLNADGTAHACTHEKEGYGNIFEVGIKAVFKEMRKWHDGSYLFEGCADCSYIDICGSGCSMGAEAYFKSKEAKDPLWRGHEEIGASFQPEIPAELEAAVDSGALFKVPERIRFRKEEGFYSINIRWANAFTIENDLAEFLTRHQTQKKPFNLAEMEGSVQNARTSLVYMVFKDAVEPGDPELQGLLEGRPRVGASINPFELLTPAP